MGSRGDCSPKQTENLGGEAECDRALGAFGSSSHGGPGHCYEDHLLTSRSEGQERIAVSSRKVVEVVSGGKKKKGG